MTYKHIGFSDSIVMKELEKVAYRTNLVQNDPEQEKVATKLTTTDDLFLDTITLATALRDNGFVKQAEKLEEKVLQYKIASKDDDKYNWWQETGSSLIDYSHQVDDYEEIPSAKGDGVVENQNEIHKILEDVLKHQPTGKVGSQNKEIVRGYIRHSAAFGPQNPLLSDFDVIFFVAAHNPEELRASQRKISRDFKCFAKISL